MAKRLFRMTVGLAIAAFLFVILIEVFAHVTWFLARAGRPDAAADSAASTLAERKPVGSHRVMEWPPEQGRTPFAEAPMLRERVAAGELKPVSERLPEDPLVIVPPEQCGPYGGSWTRFATSVNDIGVFESRITYEGLVRWDPMGREIWPNLATHWEISEDGREFTFWLRKGVRWSDGEPFSADDILFWYEDVLSNRELVPVVGREWKSGGEPVKMEKLDDYTVRFSFTEPKGLFLKQMASGQSAAVCMFAKHYFKQFHPRYTPMEELESLAEEEGLGQWYRVWRQKLAFVSNADRPVLWAWRVETPAPAQPVVFERNPYYWKVDPAGNQLPYMDRVTFEIFEPELINMKAVEGAVGMQNRHLEFSNFPLFLSKQASGGYRVLKWANGGGGTLNLALNQNHQDPVVREIIHDRRFRIALSYAINRKEMNEIGYYGMATPRQNGPPASSPYYMADYEKAYTEYSPDKANALLDEMGLDKRNRKGIRLMPDGRPIQLFIDMPSMVGNVQLMELAAEYWTHVGVKTDVKLLARELFYRRKEAAMHDCGVWWPSDEQEPTIDPRWFIPFSLESIQAVDYAIWFLSDGVNGTEPTPEIRECIDIYREVERTTDPKEQVRLFKEIIDLNRENLWVIGTVGDMPMPAIVQNDFRNVPDEAIVGWIFRTPGNTAPECYAVDPEDADAPAKGGSEE